MRERGVFTGRTAEASRHHFALALLVGVMALLARVALAPSCLPQDGAQSATLFALAQLAGPDALICAHADDGTSKPIHAADCCSDLCCQACHQLPTIPPGGMALAAPVAMTLAALLPALARLPRGPPRLLSARPRGPPLSD